MADGPAFRRHNQHSGCPILRALFANNRVTDRSQTFSYDQLNRIATAQTTATHSTDPTDCWGQAFGYDSTGNWSNLLSIAGVSSSYTGCTQGTLTVAVNTNNQIVGDTYDAAGNLWVIPGTGGATYLYNAENQMTSTSNASMNYIYDGDGNRVEKSDSKIYWMAGSEVLDGTDTTGSVTNSSFNEYVFFGGNRIARRDSSGNVFYYLADQIDSSRVIAEVPSGQPQQPFAMTETSSLTAVSTPIQTPVLRTTSSPARNGTANPSWITSALGITRQPRADSCHPTGL